MSRTFLQLCQIAISDLGVSGGTLQSTQSGLNQEQQRVCNWVSRADMLIQQLWTDWNFLWAGGLTYAAPAGATSLVFSPPATFGGQGVIRSFDEESLWYAPATNSAQRVTWIDWDRMRTLLRSQPPQTAPSPTFWAVDPSNTIQLLQALEAPATFAVDCWCGASPMTKDTDTSPIPAFSGLDQIIVERAKIIYGARENAPEILTGATAEYSDLLDKLQAYALPAGRAGRTSRNNPATTPLAYVE